MPNRELPRLTDRGRELVSYVLNSVAFNSHGDDAELESMAAKLKTTPGRLRPMLRKLAAQGWLTVEGRTAEFVYFRVDPPGRSPPDVVRSDEITPDWLPLLW